MLHSTRSKAQIAGFFARAILHNLRKRVRPKQINLSNVIVSNSTICNLKCEGCYIETYREKGSFADVDNITYFLNDCWKLNTHTVIYLAFGEPLMTRAQRKALAMHIRSFPQIQFLVFTNGMFFDEEALKLFEGLPNLIFLLSIDGPKEFNDSRRGVGVFDKIMKSADQLRRRKIPLGFSTTVTHENYSAISLQSYPEYLAQFEPVILLYLLFTDPGDLDLETRTKLSLSKENIAHFRMALPRLRKSMSFPVLDVHEFETMLGCSAVQRRSVFYDAVNQILQPCINFTNADIRGIQYPLGKTINLEEALMGPEFNGLQRISEKKCLSCPNYKVVDGRVPQEEVRHACG